MVIFFEKYSVIKAMVDNACTRITWILITYLIFYLKNVSDGNRLFIFNNDQYDNSVIDMMELETIIYSRDFIDL